MPDTRTPLALGFCTGLAAALAGVWSSAWRAGRIRPVEALRESSVDGRTMTPWRLVCGLAALAGALMTLLGPVLTAPADALKRKQYVPTVMLLIVALALLAPLLVPPTARLVGWPLARLRGATGLVVRQSALAAARRTAATAAPVLLTVGLAVCLLGITATIERAKADEAQAGLSGGPLVVPDGTPGLSRAVVANLRAVPGVDVTVTHPTTLYELEDGVALVRRSARTVEGPLPRGLPLLAGSLDALRDDTIVVDREWGRRVGESVRVLRADGSPATLRVVAVIREGVEGNGAFLTGRHPAVELAGQAQVHLRPGTDAAAAAADLQRAIAGLGAKVVPAGGVSAASDGVTGTGLRVVLGVALLYSGLSVASTMLMAARDRARDLELLRLAGATVAQVLRVVAAEALFVVALGVVLALGAAGLALGTLSVALVRLTGAPAAVAVPWAEVLAVILAATGVALVTSLLPAATPLWSSSRAKAPATPRKRR